MYTVKEMAQISNVSIKTLYHYQKIGLLYPSRIGDNAYRYYGEKEVERLQIIHIYRAMGLSLEQIKKAIDSSKEEDRLTILERQLEVVKVERMKLDQVVITLEKTVQSIKEDIEMKDKDKFKGLYQEDTLTRVLQNMVILVAKPLSFFWMAFGGFLVYYHSQLLLSGQDIFGDESWIISAFFILIGFCVFCMSFYNLIRKSTWQMLEDVNRRTSTKEHTEEEEITKDE